METRRCEVCNRPSRIEGPLCKRCRHAFESTDRMTEDELITWTATRTRERWKPQHEPSEQLISLSEMITGADAPIARPPRSKGPSPYLTPHIRIQGRERGLLIKLSKKEHQHLRDISDFIGCSMSEYIRYCAFGDMVFHVYENPQDPVLRRLYERLHLSHARLVERIRQARRAEIPDEPDDDGK